MMTPSMDYRQKEDTILTWVTKWLYNDA